MHAQKVIELLGYSTREAKVYLTALSLGECHISDIATTAQMPRTTVQVIVGKLYRDGLMNFYTMRRYKYWVPEDPERLLQKLKKYQEVVEHALPTLKLLRKNSLHRRNTQKEKVLDWHILQILADTATQPMLITAEDASIVYVNLPWEKQFGYTLEEVRGKSSRVLQSGKTPSSVYKNMWEALAAEKMFQTDEIIDRRNDGTLVTLLTTIIPVRHNGTLFYLQVLDDITEQKRREELRNTIEKDRHRQ